MMYSHSGSACICAVQAVPVLHDSLPTQGPAFLLPLFLSLLVCLTLLSELWRRTVGQNALHYSLDDNTCMVDGWHCLNAVMYKCVFKHKHAICIQVYILLLREREREYDSFSGWSE